MRDRRYLAQHRGGPLSLERHHLLALWAAGCAERVLPLFREAHPDDDGPERAIEAARAWTNARISVSEARKASVTAHASARTANEGAARYAARAAGHAVATAHMADHAPGAATYAFKAVRVAFDDQRAIEEHEWQVARLPEEIRELVMSTFEQKFAYLFKP